MRGQGQFVLRANCSTEPHDGSDLLDGGQGRDKLTGGRGNDVFQFTVLKDGGDKITDFHRQRGDNDLFVFGKASFRGAGSGELDATQFQASTTNVAEDIDTRFIFRTTDETLWFDKNGSRAGGLTLIADLQNNAAVSHDDILLL